MKCKYNQIYILCPKKYASGGPDALHQLSFYLNEIGFDNVYMIYTDLLKMKKALILIILGIKLRVLVLMRLLILKNR